MSIRFQADADLNKIIVSATIRKESGINFQTAGEANLAGVPDEEVLAKAAQEGRILVSHDKKTMPHHFAKFIATNTSPGVLLVSQSMPVASVVEELILIWSATEPKEWINRICFIPL